MLAGFKRRLELQRELNLEAWRRARVIAFCSVPQTKENPISLWDFFPLEGDPTPQEIEEMKKQRKEEGLKRAGEILKRHREGKKKKS